MHTHTSHTVRLGELCKTTTQTKRSYIAKYRNTSKQSCNTKTVDIKGCQVCSGQSPLTKSSFDTLANLDTDWTLINALCWYAFKITLIHCQVCLHCDNISQRSILQQLWIPKRDLLNCFINSTHRMEEEWMVDGWVEWVGRGADISFQFFIDIDIYL